MNQAQLIMGNGLYLGMLTLHLNFNILAIIDEDLHFLTLFDVQGSLDLWRYSNCKCPSRTSHSSSESDY